MTDQYWSPAKQDPSAIPFRNKFDGARDPLTARNAIGAVDTAFVTDAIATAGAGYQPAGSYALTADFPAGAWTAWSPTITPSAGASTITVNRARYVQLGKTIIANLDFTITASGTGSGAIIFTLPVAASASGGGASYGRETALSGYLVGGNVEPSATTGAMTSYSGVTPVSTGNRYNLNVMYERG